MRSLSVLALALAAALSLPVVAQKAEVSGAVGTAPGKGAALATVAADATVEAVDPATRTVKLKLKDGTMRSFVASEEVRNFDQIKPGDKLKVRYAEAFTIELKKDGKAAVGRTETGSLKRAAPGQKPGGVAEREVQATGDVVKVDAAAKKVSVKNAQGEIIELPVQDPEQLKLIKKGDQVQVTYRQALAIALEAPAAPEKKPAEKKK